MRIGMVCPYSFDVPGGVQSHVLQLADRFARNIAAHPADWHMMQPQWIADLSDERRAKLESGR